MIHECLSVGEGAVVEGVHFGLDPLGPRFWLLDLSVGGEDVLNFLAVAENAMAGGGEDEQVVEFGVDVRDVELVVGGFEVVDVADGLDR